MKYMSIKYNIKNLLKNLMTITLSKNGLVKLSYS